MKNLTLENLTKVCGGVYSGGNHLCRGIIEI